VKKITRDEAIARHSARLREAFMRDFAERINPKHFNFSPKLVAVVGAVIGHDYGIRDERDGNWTGLSITSDGFVIVETTGHESGAFIGSAADLERNLDKWKAELQPADRTEFERIYRTAVRDWRK
jgi:hypothetical protein